LDLPGAVQRFLCHTRPRLLIILETEIWPNLYARAQQLGISLLLVNARISDRTFARYQKFHALTAEALECTTRIGAQTRGDLQRFLSLGAPADTTELTGNLKYELQLAADLPHRGLAL
jgi:3-deoxy-D-manno-octulosonic-acid transferase